MPTSPNVNTVVSVTVTTAVAMDDALRAKVRAKVDELYGASAEIVECIDPRIIGGIILDGGGERYDASVRAQLSTVRSALSSSYSGGEQ